MASEYPSILDAFILCPLMVAIMISAECKLLSSCRFCTSTRCESRPYDLKGQLCPFFYVCEIELSPFNTVSIVRNVHLTGSYIFSPTTCGTEEISLPDNRTERKSNNGK